MSITLGHMLMPPAQDWADRQSVLEYTPPHVLTSRHKLRGVSLCGWFETVGICRKMSCIMHSLLFTWQYETSLVFSVLLIFRFLCIFS